jgi:hypothetical protein
LEAAHLAGGLVPGGGKTIMTDLVDSFGQRIDYLTTSAMLTRRHSGRWLPWVDKARHRLAESPKKVDRDSNGFR